jgi:hypothetical protein
VSARSRALGDLAAHFEALRDGAAGPLDPEAPPLYNGWETWDYAADMARRTAAEQRWRSRAARRLGVDRLLDWWDDYRGAL